MVVVVVAVAVVVTALVEVVAVVVVDVTVVVTGADEQAINEMDNNKTRARIIEPVFARVPVKRFVIMFLSFKTV